jgi:hypothetical protein
VFFGKVSFISRAFLGIFDARIYSFYKGFTKVKPLISRQKAKIYTSPTTHRPTKLTIRLLLRINPNKKSTVFCPTIGQK